MSEQAGILSGQEIERAIAGGLIGIDPLEKKNINPASIDLRLGENVSCYNNFRTPLDVKKKQKTNKFAINSKCGLVLYPGRLYLMHTVERIRLGQIVGVLDGKSSIGRLGVQVHITAGYFDPGWDGQGTLEVTTVQPVRVYAGMRICQMRFHTLVGSAVSYQDVGHYIGKTATGAVESEAFRQFQEE